MLNPYLITFSTYSTFVPGDKRVAWRYNGKRVPKNPELENFILNRTSSAPVELDDEERKIAFESFLTYCRKRSWPVGALNVRSNHTHIVTAIDCASNVAARLLKAAATQQLRKHVPRFLDIKTIWTKGAHEELLEEAGWNMAVRYTLLKQGNNDYLSTEEWLKHSSQWIAISFDPYSKTNIRFDGIHLTRRPIINNENVNNR